MRALAMAGLLTAGAALALPVNARAADVRVFGQVLVADRDDGRYYRGDWRGAGPAFRYGYDRGWREGSDEGYKDGRHNHDPRYWREGSFHDGDRGYKHWMGAKREYVSGYREGYAAGYRRAYASARPGSRDRDGYYGDRSPYYRNGGYYPDNRRYPDDRRDPDDYDR